MDGRRCGRDRPRRRMPCLHGPVRSSPDRGPGIPADGASAPTGDALQIVQGFGAGLFPIATVLQRRVEAAHGAAADGLAGGEDGRAELAGGHPGGAGPAGVFGEFAGRVETVPVEEPDHHASPNLVVNSR
ncbi:hypothetical protein [Bifidobacterium reuteri]|uniref:hypothetical protein n=1 Tax=Bifidobacterium reuteri TaxID=983706 RepID=UPI0012E00715|nr:hypothetical protein [Bifidobacterium reuteri]